jgi:RNA polymerase sigma-70 factor (ECF subfamily)
MQPMGAQQPAVVDERELVQRLKAGDQDAYEVLVRTHSSRLLAVTRRILTSEDDARDAVQDAFILAFRNIRTFEGESRLSTWLHRVAINAALMKLRSRRRRPEEPLDPLLPSYQDDGHHVEQFQSWEEPADDALARRRRRALVRESIERLPENYRTVLLLRDIEEIGTEEAAQMLGISVNAVKIRLHRARQALRTLLDRHYRGGLA